MRRFVSLLGVAAAVPTFLAVPVLARPAVAPRPVSPRVVDLAVAPTPTTTGVVADTGRRATRHFTLVGATWRTGTLPRTSTIELRTRHAGSWSTWTPLPLPDGGPDDGSADARAAAAHHVSATEPLWVGSADGVQARVVDASGATGAAPRGLHLVLVDGGSSKADASPGPAHPLGGSVAQAAQAQPTIYTRAQWGADENLRKRECPNGPDYGSTIKMGFVHHTDGTNNYTASQVPSIIRSIYAYHVQSNGWCDIGYNFLVDRFGRIWEGRYGGINRPVIGAHTGGFNTDSFAASLIGAYGSTAPSSAMLAAVERLFAWKLGAYYLNPAGKATMTAGSFSGSRYPTGSHPIFNVISGHRDADTTTCPGNAAYAELPTIRSAVTKLIGAGFVTPTVSPSTVRMLSGQTFSVRAGVLTSQSWTANVTDVNGATVKTLAGAATTSSGVASVWDATGPDGLPAPPGTYTVTLTGSNAAGSTAVPYTQRVTVAPPVSVSGPVTATYGAPVTLTGTAAPNGTVTVTLQPAAQGAPADVRSVTATSAGTWTTSFTANDDYSWSASVPTPDGRTWSTSTKTTTVAPEITTPQLGADRRLFVAQGGTLSLSGTGLPNTNVQLVTTPQGGSTSTGQPITVRADGTWTGFTVAPTTPTVVSVQRDAATSSAPVTVYPVGAPSVSAPQSGYAQRGFAITGNAGGAPVTVQLWTQAPGAPDYSLTGAVAAAANGAFALAGTLPATSTPASLAWKVVTSAAGTEFGQAQGSIAVQPLFAPTANAVSLGYYRHYVTVSGRAVPGDPVTLWTKPSSGGSWARVSTVRANGTTGAFGAPFLLLRDTVWRVTAPTGATTTRGVILHPTLHGPAKARRGVLLTLWGYGIPGQRAAFYRRPIGTSRWLYCGTVTAGSTGKFVGRVRLSYPMNIVVRSHSQLSPVLSVRFA